MGGINHQKMGEATIDSFFDAVPLFDRLPSPLFDRLPMIKGS